VLASALAEDWDGQACADEALTLATRYCWTLSHAKDGAERTQVDQEFPDVTTAHRIFRKAGLLRDELDARLLAEQTTPMIAIVMNLAVGTVKTYADLFFAIEERRNAADWMLLYAVRVGPWGPVDLDEGAVWRCLGWQCPAAMECVIRDYQTPAALRDPAAHAQAEQARLLVRSVCTPLRHRSFRPLLRQMINDTMNRALAHPTVELAQQMHHLETCQMATRRRNRRLRQTEQTATTVLARREGETMKALAAPKRRGALDVTQFGRWSDDLGDSQRPTLPLSDLPGWRGPGAATLPGTGLSRDPACGRATPA